jgi:thiol-disulfide isomerase/thioredoxin
MIRLLILGICIALIIILVVQSCGTKVYYFYKPGCPYCEEMNDEWNKFELQNLLSVRAIKVNINNPKNYALKKQYNVQLVPTIIKIVNGSPYIYNGPRTAKDLSSWVN